MYVDTNGFGGIIASCIASISFFGLYRVEVDIGFGFRHIAHRRARQTNRTQSPVRKQRVFFVLGGIYRLTSKVYLNYRSNFWRTYG